MTSERRLTVEQIRLAERKAPGTTRFASTSPAAHCEIQSQIGRGISRCEGREEGPGMDPGSCFVSFPLSRQFLSNPDRCIPAPFREQTKNRKTDNLQKSQNQGLAETL
jgi:hypothetical protein